VHFGKKQPQESYQILFIFKVRDYSEECVSSKAQEVSNLPKKGYFKGFLSKPRNLILRSASFRGSLRGESVKFHQKLDLERSKSSNHFE